LCGVWGWLSFFPFSFGFATFSRFVFFSRGFLRPDSIDQFSVFRFSVPGLKKPFSFRGGWCVVGCGKGSFP